MNYLHNGKFSLVLDVTSEGLVSLWDDRESAWTSGEGNVLLLELTPQQVLLIETFRKIKLCHTCRGTGHSGNLHDELCQDCDGGGRLDGLID